MLRKRMSKVTKNGKRLRKTDVKRRKTEEKERQKGFKTRPKVTQKFRKSQAFEEVMMPSQCLSGLRGKCPDGVVPKKKCFKTKIQPSEGYLFLERVKFDNKMSLFHYYAM